MEIAQNSFNGGLLKDMHPTVTPNTVLTDCVNGTIITFDGNEFLLQNDLGNGRVESCVLKKDFVPLGIKQYGGIIYIASVNPLTGECELGSFPSPERNITSDELPNNLDIEILNSDVYQNGSINGISINYLKVDFGDLENNILRPGDKFLIYITSDSDYNEFIKYFKDLNYIDGKRRLYSLHLAKISENGTVTYIENQTVPYRKDFPRFFYTQEEAFGKNTVQLKTVQNEALFNIYNDKLNGYLAIVLEIEDIDSFSVELGNTEVTSQALAKDKVYDLEFSIESTSESYNNTWGVDIECLESDTESNTITLKENNKNCIVSDNKYLEINPSSGEQFQNINIASISQQIPNSNITLKGKIQNLKESKEYKLKIIPYSRFQEFKDLEYNTILSYSDLVNNKNSSIWRYSTNSMMNYYNEEYKQVEISTDFITRGTKNGLNKCTAMYIEFYDLHADTSFIYPLSKVISGSYNFTIDCFSKDLKCEPYYDQDGNELTDLDFNKLVGENNIFVPKSSNYSKNGYFLLLDKSKQIRYLDDINKGDDGLEDLKKLCEEETNGFPCCIWIKPQLGNNEKYYYNNCFTQKDSVNSSEFNKLRYNNFYICRLCGLDIYKSESDEELTFDSVYQDGGKYYTEGILTKNFKCIEYNAIYTLITNGWFNKEYIKSVKDSVENFSLLPFTNYMNKILSNDIQFNETEESLNNTVTVSGNNPETYEDLVLDPDASTPVQLIEYKTDLNINKSISGDYSLKNINLLQYGKLNLKNEEITPKFTDELLEEEYNDNLKTNSSILNFTNEQSGETNNDRTININVKLNRYIQSKATEKKLTGDSIGYKKFYPSGILGYSDGALSSGIPFFHDSEGKDWITFREVLDIFSTSTFIKDSWKKNDKSQGGFDKTNYKEISLIRNRIYELMGSNNNVAIMGFTGDKSKNDGPDLLRKNNTIKTGVCLWSTPDTSVVYPRKFVIIYKPDPNTLGMIPILFINNNNAGNNGTIRNNIAKFFDSLYIEEIISGGLLIEKIVPNDIKYHSIFDSIVSANLNIDDKYTTEILTKNDISLYQEVGNIITNYINKKSNLINILNENIISNYSNEDNYNQKDIISTFIIPIKYTFKSNIFTSYLNKYYSMYLLANEYDSYTTVTEDSLTKHIFYKNSKKEGYTELINWTYENNNNLKFSTWSQFNGTSTKYENGQIHWVSLYDCESKDNLNSYSIQDLVAMFNPETSTGLLDYQKGFIFNMSISTGAYSSDLYSCFVDAFGGNTFLEDLYSISS